MARSSFHCPHSHHHDHRCHHFHHDLTLPESSIDIREDWRNLSHSKEETDFTTSQSETETSAYDITNTTTDHSCLCPTANSKRVTLRHEVYPLHVSVNLRLGGTNTVLLPEDVFIPTAGSETLESVFEAALVRYPQHVGRYILRKEKDVIVLCHDEAKNTYSKTSAVFAALSKLRPIRFIFCVVPNVDNIRELDSQKIYKVKVNARTESDPECILEKDIMVEARGSVSAKQLWDNLSKWLPQIRGLFPTGLLTRRPADRIVVRFGMHDFVADLVKSRGHRFVFILGGHLVQQKQRRHTERRRHTEQECLRQCGRRNDCNPNNMKCYRPWFRFRPCRLWSKLFSVGDLVGDLNAEERGALTPRKAQLSTMNHRKPHVRQESDNKVRSRF